MSKAKLDELQASFQHCTLYCRKYSILIYRTISDVQAPECTWRSSSIGNLEISFHPHVRWRCCLSHWLASTLRPLQPLILCSSSLFKQLIRPEQLRFRNCILISHFVQGECVARKHSWK
ncbi:hypothetical protein T03_1159 [Trichinella britovi]|uniref:Uncharacterized protein n=1 Tax=Trichinella britovi TaxID=45882 RepID=A0A0V1C4K4_TRIBR|nr:hypothetical protein T03_1159 [Trichinella britovi]